MLKKITLAVAALAVSAAFLGAGSASAATLYKTTAKTTTVPVGATFTATMPFWDVSKRQYPTPEQKWTQYSEGKEVSACTNVSVNYKVTQNSGGVFKAEMTGLNFPKGWECTSGTMTWGGATGAKVLEVSGSSTAVGTESAWLGTKLGIFWIQTAPYEIHSESLTGATGNPPANGVFMQQSTAAKAPISINIVKAALAGEWAKKLTAKFVFSGEAAAWSFG
jgi:hypothetical protein